MRMLNGYEDPPQEVPPLPRTGRGKKPGLLIPIVVAGCLIGLAFFVCAASVISIVVAVIATGNENQDEWLALTDTFMQAMADGDLDAAHTLFAEEARREVKRSDLATLIDGPFFALFDGYLDLEIESWIFTDDLLERRSVELTGPVNYQKGYTGVIEIVLTEEEDAWKVRAFNVMVPPEKINAYAAKQP